MPLRPGVAVITAGLRWGENRVSNADMAYPLCVRRERTGDCPANPANRPGHRQRALHPIIPRGSIKFSKAQRYSTLLRTSSREWSTLRPCPALYLGAWHSAACAPAEMARYASLTAYPAALTLPTRSTDSTGGSNANTPDKN